MADVNKTTAVGSAPGGGLKLKIVSPEKTLFEGYVESVIIKTTDGYEGFLKDRATCCKLLAEDGNIRLREAGAEFKNVKTKGGFAYMNGDMTIYADEADWDEA